jgi:condensin complex subunit 3
VHLPLKYGTEAFWTDLTPERAFLARVFVQHCISTSSNARLETALPVVTALAFRIQSNYNDLLELIQAEEEDKVLGGDEDERAKKEEVRCDKEFVVGEMCVLAVRLDYSDEIGRRKMFQLVRQ